MPTHNDPKLARKVFIGVALLTLIRLLWHLLEPIGMVGDETYYWEWGRRPELGYYSKPPLIGWLYGLLGWIGNDQTYVFKAAATLMAGAALAALFIGTRAASSTRVAAWATLLAAFTPGNLLSASLLTIDAPLLLFWSIAFALSAQILFQKERPRTSQWLLLAVTWGLGYLAKQMMMFQPLLFIFAAAACRRELLKRPAIYLAIAASFLALTPPMIWNAQNDWVTFTHTAHHFESASDPFFQRCGDFLGAVIGGITTPITGVMMIVSIFCCLKTPRRMDKAERFFFLYGALGLIGISLLLLRQELNPNWPAVYFIGAFALTAKFWTEHRQSGLKWMRRAAILAALMSVLAMSYLPLRAQLGWSKSQRRLDMGFRQGAEQVDAVIDRLRTSPTEAEFEGIIVLGHRFEASQLAFHLRENPQLFHFPRGDYVRTQYDVWPGPKPGKSYLLIRIESHAPGRVPDPKRPFPEGLETAFELAKIRPLAKNNFTIPLTKRSRSYEFFLTGPLQQWPQPSDSHE